MTLILFRSQSLLYKQQILLNFVWASSFDEISKNKNNSLNEMISANHISYLFS